MFDSEFCICSFVAWGITAISWIKIMNLVERSNVVAQAQILAQNAYF